MELALTTLWHHFLIEDMHQVIVGVFDVMKFLQG